MGDICIIAKLYRIDLVNCGDSRERKTLSFRGRNMVNAPMTLTITPDNAGNISNCILFPRQKSSEYHDENSAKCGVLPVALCHKIELNPKTQQIFKLMTPEK